MINKACAVSNWVQFKDVPCDSKDCITKPFRHFDVGTNKFTIYLWFEEEYQCDVVEHLIPMMESN